MAEASDLAELEAHLTVPGEPVPWQRARRNGGRYFKAAQVVEFEERVKAAWLVEGRPALGATPLQAGALFVFARPSSHLCRDGVTLRKGAPAFPPKRDVDNCLKGLLDPLSQLAFDDDGQVVKATVEKRYATAGEEPHTVLELRPV